MARRMLDGRVFDASQLSAVYQPIVDLASGEIVGAEALARWPELSIDPVMAFGLARETGRVEELDELCQRAALAGAIGAGVPDGFRLFVNVEPDASARALAEASAVMPVIAEITERALLEHPAELLGTVRRLRERGCGIALDDVGAVPASLSLLPFVAPDVIKLDVSLVRAWPGPEQARILTAVAAYAERAGATVLAEGIETRRDLGQAMALGATLGQGWYFWRPGPLRVGARVASPIPLLGRPWTRASTPFELVDPEQVRIGPKGLLLAISRHIEAQGLTLETPPIVLSAFQDARHFSPSTARRYEALAERCPLVGAIGAGLAASPAAGVRGASLGGEDPLCDEWTVVVVGPHYAGALIGLDAGDTGPEIERRFRFVLTHDYDCVTSAARALLERLEPGTGAARD